LFLIVKTKEGYFKEPAKTQQMSGNKVEHLMEKCVIARPGLILRLLSMSYEQTRYNKLCVSGLFFLLP
jgi:hypothetical protein